MGKNKSSFVNKLIPSKKGKEKESSSSRAPPALSITGKLDPKNFKVKVTSAEAKRRWSHLITMPHKQCRFLHEATTRAMGIHEEVVLLAQQIGFEHIFRANYFAYHVLTVEFLSTLEVRKRDGTPMSLHFNLGGEPRSLTTDELNAIINGPEDGSFTGEHLVENQELWKKLIFQRDESMVVYNSTYAKATSIRNPMFRYVHRLFSSTILSRKDVGTCLSTDLHLLWASMKSVKQHAGCYLAEHMEKQAQLFGGQKIGIGAFVTPIARHFGVQINEEPISKDIFLDKMALQKQEMLAYDDAFLWKLHDRNKAVVLFSLPHPSLTSVMGDAPEVYERWSMSSVAHLALVRPAGAPCKRQRVQASVADEDEERAEEEEA